MSKKIVLITGASSGIGKKTAAELSKEGFIVYGAARKLEKMTDLNHLGVKLLGMDITEDQSIVTVVKRILEAEGRIDVLINNAGFGSYGAIEDVSLSDAKYQMEVNLFGAARMIQQVLPKMIENRYGKIVNISSIGGKTATAFGGWYHASKFALEALSDSLRNEVRSFGVDVIVIEPGGIKTEWGGIAAENLLKTSGNGRYREMVKGFATMLNSAEENTGADPKIIANLIHEAITAEIPETRYVGGFMANEILEMRKNLSDKEFDKMLHGQLNM